jgi:iron(III) transport system permease protein
VSQLLHADKRKARTIDAGAARWRLNPVVAAAAAVAAFCLLPIVFVAWLAVNTGWETAVALVFRARVGELLFNTVLLQICALPPTIVVAVALAWVTERASVPWPKFWSWLAISPLAAPAFLHSYAWTTIAPSFHGLAAAVLISVLAYAPFLYLPVAAQLRRLDPALEEAASSLGLSPARVFWRVILPQLRLGICAGALLVGLHLLAEYGLFALVRYDTFTTAIMDQFQSAYNAPAANMLGGILVLCSLALLRIESLVRGNERRYARVGSGAARTAPSERPNWRSAATLALPLAYGALALGVPFVVLGRWLWLGGRDVWNVDVLSALSQTAVLAIAGAVLTTLAAAPMAWLSIRQPGRLQRALEACHLYAGSLPGVVIGLAIVAFAIRFAHPLYQTAATVLLAYVLLFLPRALSGLKPSLAQAPVELEQAAASLGRTPLQAFLSVTLRLAAPGVAASLCLVSLAVATELTATLMLAPNGTRTLATAFWALVSEIDYMGAAPYAASMVLVSAPMTFLLYSQSQRIAGR